VQSAYETLLVSAPADPAHVDSMSHQPPPRSAGRRRDPYEELSSKKSPQKASYHSSFRRPSNPGEVSLPPRLISLDIAREAKPQATRPPSDESKIDRQEASGVAQMSTEQLRRSLRAIGVSLLTPTGTMADSGQFTRLEGCSREELVKKFLAAKSHFAQKSSSGDGGGAATGESDWGDKMHRRMDKERQKEWRREEAQVAASLLTRLTRLTPLQPKKASSSSSSGNQHSSDGSSPPALADLSIAELKRLCSLR
jgi:hypothetical protein